METKRPPPANNAPADAPSRSDSTHTNAAHFQEALEQQSPECRAAVREALAQAGKGDSFALDKVRKHCSDPWTYTIFSGVIGVHAQQHGSRPVANPAFTAPDSKLNSWYAQDVIAAGGRIERPTFRALKKSTYEQLVAYQRSRSGWSKAPRSGCLNAAFVKKAGLDASQAATLLQIWVNSGHLLKNTNGDFRLLRVEDAATALRDGLLAQDGGYKAWLRPLTPDVEPLMQPKEMAAARAYLADFATTATPPCVFKHNADRLQLAVDVLNLVQCEFNRQMLLDRLATMQREYRRLDKLSPSRRPTAADDVSRKHGSQTDGLWFFQGAIDKARQQLHMLETPQFAEAALSTAADADDDLTPANSFAAKVIEVFDILQDVPNQLHALVRMKDAYALEVKKKNLSAHVADRLVHQFPDTNRPYREVQFRIADARRRAEEVLQTLEPLRWTARPIDFDALLRLLLREGGSMGKVNLPLRCACHLLIALKFDEERYERIKNDMGYSSDTAWLLRNHGPQLGLPPGDSSTSMDGLLRIMRS